MDDVSLPPAPHPEDGTGNPVLVETHRGDMVESRHRDAEGVYTAILPKRGLGIALKIDDGASRAAELAMLQALRLAGALDDERSEALTRRLVPVQTNWSGREVGEFRIAAAFAA